MAYRFGLASMRDYAFAAPFEDGLDDAPHLFQTRAAAAPWIDLTASSGTSLAYIAKGYTDFVPDGVGVLKPTPPVTPSTLITADLQPGDTTTTSTIIVGGPSIVSTIDTIGDQDFFRIDLVAGQTYEIGVYAKVGGPNLIPLADAYLELYDAAGNLVVTADGGGPNTPSGLDALLTYTADHTGTYYINARGFDNVAEDGPNGDTVGDYEVFARVAPPGGYQPYYDVDSPLYAIDWGTQLDNSSRNPDGAEGPRPTENPFTGVGSNPYGIVGKNVVTYYLAKAGEVYIDEDPTTPGTTDTMVAKGWADWEENALNLAFDAYENVADIVYVEVNTRAEADFIFITYNGTPGPGVSLLGRMSPPDEENEGRGEFNALDERWTEEGLAPGGFTFTTLIHEMGHGHGLAHPHDNGGHSGVMHGVESDGPAFDYTNGDFDLNQSIYTMMSYEDGWQKSPYGQAESTDPFGWLGSLMAFDVAAIQDKYGVNESYKTGNDVYLIDDENVAGTYYSCIWDAGGRDEIRYTGARDATIDLRAATLKYEYGGGGWLSYAYGVFGGFTIANGVTIENATGGSGLDHITGNDAANVLTGGLGDDVIIGGGGNDTLNGEGGIDDLNGGLGDDRLLGGDGDDILSDLDNGADSFYGGAGNDTLRVARALGTTAAVMLDGGDGDDHFVIQALSGAVTAKGGAGVDRFDVSGAANIFTGDGADRVVLASDFDGVLTVSDFKQGAGGDRLDLDAWFAAHLTNWNGTANPFTTGHVRILKSGSDTLVQVDANGGGDAWTTLVLLKAVNTTLLTAENLGYAPVISGSTLTGTPGADTLTGGNGAEVISGLGGNDLVKGQGGNDTVNGDAGNDTLYGGMGDDIVNGGTEDDLMYGGDGADVLNGGDGLDRLFGDAGNDTIDGGAKADKIYGGAGQDVLTGGQDADQFIFQALSDSVVGAADRIMDFNAAEDRIDLKAIDADTGLAGNQAFHFVSSFTNHAGEATLAYDSGANVTTLQLDVNGDGVADFALMINGSVGTSAGWVL